MTLKKGWVLMAAALAVLLYMGQTAANTAASADFDGNGVVEVADFLLFVEAFGAHQGHEKYEAKYDLDDNGVIGIPDFLIFVDNFGKTVPVRPAPVFADDRTNRTLDENTLPGEKVGDPIAVVGLDSLTYRLSGAQADSFAIDASTGQIRTREGVRYDYERQKTYLMYVVVRDQSDSDPDSIVVIITLNDVKEPPSLPPSSFLVIPDDRSLSVHYAQVHDEPGRPPVRGYHAELRKGEDGEWGNRKTIYGRNNTSFYYHKLDVPRYQNPYLINGQLYQVRVRSWNTDGASAWSDPVSGTPKPRPPKPQVVYSVTSPVEFQDDPSDTETSAAISISGSTGQGGMVVVPKAALPNNIQDVAEAVFVEIAQIANVPEVPPNTGFTILEHSPVYDIVVKARLASGEDVDIGDNLGASVEICLPVPENNSRAVLVHYEGGTWQRLSTQRIEGNTICGFVDNFSLFAVGASTVSIPAQREALVALYNATGGPNWTNNTNWLTDNDISTWYGVIVFNGQVTRLVLSENSLSGNLPSELGNLTNLEDLSLRGNHQLSGSIPTELGNLNNLRVLSLGYNQLSGSIPTELGNLNNLSTLTLSYNQLSGSIPTELGNLTNLGYLNLRGNQLSGSIPTELGNLNNLTFMGLGINQLSGEIPTELGNLTNLTYLNFRENQLSGTIPPELGELSNLRALFLQDNQLSGSIPTALGNLSELTALILRKNQLSGTIPPELGNLTNLTFYLSLQDNLLSGEIPSALGNLINLKELNFHRNASLEGPLPQSLTRLTKLEKFRFSNTGLCAPLDAAFQAWLEGIAETSGSNCSE